MTVGNLGEEMRYKVTIGICARNCEKTIADAIESIMEQDFPHELMEVIFVDDGSQDKTFSIMQKYAKMDISLKIFRKRWQGLGASRNLIVKNARSEYIIWVDCDEVLSKEFVRKQIEYMDKNPKVGISLGFVLLPESNLLLKLELLPAMIDRIKFLRQGIPLRRANTGASAFRLEALTQIKGFDERLSGAGEDVEVANRMKSGGWLWGATYARFWERKNELVTLRQLWKTHFEYGCGNHKVYLNNKKAINPLKMDPFSGMLAGILYSFDVYRLTKMKSIRLLVQLPAIFAFKRIAWCLAFTKAHIEMLRKKFCVK